MTRRFGLWAIVFVFLLAVSPASATTVFSFSGATVLNGGTGMGVNEIAGSSDLLNLTFSSTAPVGSQDLEAGIPQFFKIGEGAINEGDNSIGAGEVDNLSPVSVNFSTTTFGDILFNATTISVFTGIVDDAAPDLILSFVGFQDIAFGNGGIVRISLYAGNNDLAGQDIGFGAWDGGQISGEVWAKFEVTQSEIPEPTTSALFGIGLLGLGLVTRRRNSATRHKRE